MTLFTPRIFKYLFTRNTLLAALIVCVPCILNAAAELVIRDKKAGKNTYSMTYTQNGINVTCIQAHAFGKSTTAYQCSPENAVAQKHLAKEFARLHDAYGKQERIATR